MSKWLALAMMMFVSACSSVSDDCAWVRKIDPDQADTINTLRQVLAHNTKVDKFCRY